jgi:hypothetical protein
MGTTRKNITRFKEAEATRSEQSVPVRADGVDFVDTVPVNGYLAELLKRRLEPLEVRVVKSNEPERQLRGS